MNTHRLLRQTLLSISILLSSHAMTWSALALEPTTTAAQGDYAVARLELSSGLAGTPQQLFVALRQGRLANLWFVTPIDGDQRLNVESSSLVLSERALKGEIKLRTAEARERPIIPAQLELDLTIAENRLSGVYELACGKSKYKSSKGTATGTLHRSASALDTIAPSAAWTSFSGANDDMSAQPQPPLVEDLSHARPVWRSEAYVPTSYGNAADSRYFLRALISGSGGGGSSPVVANGTVFIHFYLPNEQRPAVLANPYWERLFKDDAAFRQKMVELNANEQESQWVVNHFRPVADDHIVAIDAATGATKWRTVLPQRSPNLQTHKHRGVSGVPLVAGDTIYVPNLSSRLYALDAANGKLKWEVPTFDANAKDQPVNSGPANPSPYLLNGVLVWARAGHVFGFDPATGAEKWKTPGGHFLRWSNGGQNRLLAFAGKSLVCLEPATGKTLWSQETDLFVHAPRSAVVAQNLLIGTPALNKSDGTFRYRALRLTETGATELWQAAPLVPDENVPVLIAHGRAYLLAKQAIHAVDLQTGKMVAQRTFTTHGPGSNAWLGAVGERFLFLPEGQHGTAKLGLLDRDLNSLGELWQPTNTATTAYNSQPIIYPIVDGRLIVRGGDAVYCYDLRKK